jgi:hypothetical protein
MLHVKKVDFALFIAMVINCTAEAEKKSKKIGIIVNVAEHFLGSSRFYSRGSARNPASECSPITGP